MKKMPNIVDLLSASKDAGDLWDEFNESDLKPNSVILIINYNTQYTLRFLGPFVKMYRFYCFPLTHQEALKSKIDIRGIANKEEKAIKDALSVATQFNKQGLLSNMEYSIFTKHLSKVTTSNIWQKCIAVNALVLSPDNIFDKGIKLAVLTSSFCNTIFNRLPSEHAVINGLYAHNISFIKRKEGYEQERFEEIQRQLNRAEEPRRTFSSLAGNPSSLTPASPPSQLQDRIPQPYFEVDVENLSSLSNKHISYIVKHGLYDIPSVIEEVNKKNRVFYYKIQEKYRMPSEFNKTLFEGRNRQEENTHFDCVEHQINELPVEAFEKRRRINSPIVGLDLG